MILPEFKKQEDGFFCTDWVIGEYAENIICPYRIVRAVREKELGKVCWEYADQQGEDEDLWPIKAPMFWKPFRQRRQG